jgi:hypothetical protein
MANTFFLMGRSHLTSLWSAYHDTTGEGVAPETPYAQYRLTQPGCKMRFMQLGHPEFDPLFVGNSFNPAVLAGIAEAGAQVHVSVLGGNDHSMIGVAGHEPRLDFLLPEAPEQPVEEGALIVPAEMLRQELSRRIAPHIQALEFLRRAVSGRVIHVESPPPLPEPHIRRYPVPFGEEIAAYGVAPAPLRYKLWRLHSCLYQEACSRLGIDFLPSPPEIRDADGMLLAHACHQDATHANVIYGGHVLAKLLALAG